MSTCSQQELKYSQDTVCPQVIALSGVGVGTNFSCMATTKMPYIFLTGNTQVFPRYRLYTTDKNKGGFFETTGKDDGNGVWHGQISSDNRIWIDNITDTALRNFRENYGDDTIVKDDIFSYCYGILHSEGYRSKYKNDLTKELARIPLAPDFWAFSKIGEQLADLHCGYDKLDGWEEDKLRWEMTSDAQEYLMKVASGDTSSLPEILDKDEDGRKFLNPLYCPKKMQWGDDGSTLKINDHITIRNIPPGAHSYRLAGKSPLQILVSEYYPKKHKATGIVNDRNLLFKDAPHQLLHRIRQLIQVGVETTALLSQLPEEFETAE